MPFRLTQRLYMLAGSLRELRKLHRVSPDVIPWSFRVDKDVHSDLYARVTINTT